MKIRSVKANYILNIIRAFSYALITILTMPYINKTLGPVNIGKVEFANTVINYFILLSGLGINIYGIREIARVRDSKKRRDKTTLELLLILSITSVVAYVLLFVIIYQFGFFSSYIDLLILMSIMIALTNMGAEWYFQGMEDQLYITIRYVGVRILALILIFFMIKEPQDYYIYAAILVLIVCGSNIFNLYFLVKEIDFSSFTINELNLKQHFKPLLTIFIAAISVNIYLQLDNFMISSVSGDLYLGYYSVANKLIRFVITFITIVGMVLLPRLSKLYSEDRVLYMQYLRSAFYFILNLALPSTIVFFVFAKNITMLFAGSQFEPAIITMQILSPLCIIVGIAYFLGYLVLYTQGSEKVYTRAVIISAVFSLLSNLIAIKYYQQNGAAVVAVLSELFAILIMMYFAKDSLKELQIININFFKICAGGMVVFLLAMLSNIIFETESLFNSVIIILLTYFLYGLLMLACKEEVSYSIGRIIKQKISTK